MTKAEIIDQITRMQESRKQQHTISLLVLLATRLSERGRLESSGMTSGLG